jgi:hypothetical protein
MLQRYVMPNKSEEAAAVFAASYAAVQEVPYRKKNTYMLICIHNRKACVELSLRLYHVPMLKDSQQPNARDRVIIRIHSSMPFISE